MAEKIKIKPVGKRTSFNVEILLSDKQLMVLCELGGDEGAELMDTYKLLADGDPVDISPSFDCGLGADLNDVLSLGFIFLKHLQEGQKTKLTLDDLWFHPFRRMIPDVKSVDVTYLDCEIETDYVPITSAIIDPETDEP